MDEHRKERNIARSKPEKLERLKRNQERDISEKIALGLPDARARTGETQFDSRLFNQSKVIAYFFMEYELFRGWIAVESMMRRMPCMISRGGRTIMFRNIFTDRVSTEFVVSCGLA